MRNLKFLSLFLFVFSIFSCSPFTASISDYYNKYTESAGLLDVEYPENSIFSNKIQLNCVGSDANSIINLNLFNPKKLNMQIVFEIDIESEIGSALTNGNQYFEEGAYQIVNLNENPSRAQLVFNKGFINYIDSGKITDSNGKPVKTIIGTITTGIPIEDSENYRDIREYPFTISFNSTPPDIKNAMLQLTQNGSGQYVLCFYLPKVKDTVHECDTKKIKIGSETYYFKDTGSGVNFYTDEECNTAADSNKINTSYGTGTLYPLHSGGVTFSGTAPSGYYPVYYFTETSMSADEIKYDIVLEDDFGLYKSVGVSSKGEKLTAVNIPDDTSYFGTDDGYYEIQLTHNGKTITNNTVSGVTIYYTVEQGGSVVTSGSGASGVKVKLPSGKKGYKIKAVARKPYFVESDEENQSGISVARSFNYFIHQNGNDVTGDGTRANPYQSFKKCLEIIDDEHDAYETETEYTAKLETSETGYTINLLSNITSESTESFTSAENYAMVNITKPYKYTINGNGHTIDAKRDDTKKGRVLYAEQCTLTINDVVIRGGYSPFYGSGICLDEDSIGILNNVEITNNKMYTIEGYAELVMGGGLAVYNECVYNSGSIHDNTSVRGGGFACVFNTANVTFGTENSKVSIYNNTVSENGGGIHYDTGSIKIINADVYDNFVVNSDETKVKNNIYLRTDKTITVGGNLSGCTIGVTTADKPSSGNTIQITNGYSNNNNLPPSKIFKSDAEGYGVIMDEINGQEAVLAKGGGIIDVPTQIYDNVKISVDKTVFLTKNTGNSLTVTSMVKPDSSYVNIPLNECTYSYELYNHGEKVNGIISTGSAKNIVNFNCASLPNESFELYVYLEYKGKKYQGVFPIEVYVGQGTPVTNSNEFKNALTAGGEIQLCKDTTVSDTLTIGGPCTINGNGKSLKMNKIDLNSADSPYTVDIKNITIINNGSCIFNVKQNVTLNLKKGAVIDFNNVPQGSTVVPTYNINVDGGFFNMEEGSCIKQSAASAAVFVKGNGIFTMDGGEICDNNCYRSPVYILNAKAYINGGKIHDNKGTPAVYIADSTCEMNGGEIYSNIISAGSCSINYDCSGAAIFCSADSRSDNVSFKMTGGKIYNNFAYNNGGALCLIAVNSEISGGEITNNVCGLHGGAIYNGRGVGSFASKGTCTIKPEAKVENNFVNASFNTANPDFTQGTEEKIYDTSNAADNVNEYRH